MKFPAQNLRRQLGQGMTEYIIIVALIAVAGISTFALFGNTIQSQAASVASGLTGAEANATTQRNQAVDKATDAATQGNTARGMNNFNAGSSDDGQGQK